MTRPTSESIFNITPQGSEFCNQLDPVLDPLLKILSKIEELKDLTHSDSDVKSDPKTNVIKLFNQPIIEKYDFNVTIFKTMSDEMDSWFTGWLNLFNESIEKEQKKLLKHDLEGESMFYQFMIERFRSTSTFFIEESVKTVHRYNQSIEKINQSVSVYHTEDGCEHEYYDALSDAASALVEIEGLIERIREAASLTRECTNKELKIRTKTQLYRVNNKTFKSYLTEHRIFEERDFHRWAYYDFKFSISRKYMY